MWPPIDWEQMTCVRVTKMHTAHGAPPFICCSLCWKSLSYPHTHTHTAVPLTRMCFSRHHWTEYKHIWGQQKDYGVNRSSLNDSIARQACTPHSHLPALPYDFASSHPTLAHIFALVQSYKSNGFMSGSTKVFLMVGESTMASLWKMGSGAGKKKTGGATRQYKK